MESTCVPQARNFANDNKLSSEDSLATRHWRVSPDWTIEVQITDIATKKNIRPAGRIFFLVTSLGENWNTFWEELEHFDEGFKDLLPEEDC